MKGIILAGGSGTRLHPLTLTLSKQLLPVYDKPMIYYPLSVLMLAGIREILIISTPQDIDKFQTLLGTGNDYGCSFSYEIQDRPRGLAEAFIIGEKFIGDDKVALILGDNIFYGSGFVKTIRKFKNIDGAGILAYSVKDPERFGIVEIINGLPVSIEEKPQNPKSNYAVPGLYFYDNNVKNIVKSVMPSERGEIEITSINDYYLKNGKLKVYTLDRGTAWFDTGTFDSLSDASNFVRLVEQRQNNKIGCIEEVSFIMGYIDAIQLKKVAKKYLKSGYGNYLLELIKTKNNYE
ncbi:glucose-1-phosphate thymidylyltransferase RfbA [Flavobacteriaceae bacterium]|nr:glucose-1-phosphate thymidylyltransferase RfbA [Flavobacteriaceae bacterium]